MIYAAKIEELRHMTALAREFYAASKQLGTFHRDRFIAFWTDLLTKGNGVIFLLVDDAGRIDGTIGGIVYEDPYSENRIAQEFFWFVHANARGQGTTLYRCFELWARERGADEIRMAHLSDSMPEKVEHFYRRMGFEKVETLYAKRLPSAQMRSSA